MLSSSLCWRQNEDPPLSAKCNHAINWKDATASMRVSRNLFFFIPTRRASGRTSSARQFPEQSSFSFCPRLLLLLHPTTFAPLSAAPSSSATTSTMNSKMESFSFPQLLSSLSFRHPWHVHEPLFSKMTLAFISYSCASSSSSVFVVVFTL